MKYWNSLGKKRQNEILIGVTFSVVAIYLLAWHWQNYTELTHAENMVSRAENRLQLKEDSIPEAPPSAGKLVKEIERQTERQKELTYDHDQISSIFMPLDQVQAYQSLRLSISDLAESNRVRIESVNEVNQGRVTLDANGEPGKFVLSKKWGRPLLQYSLNLRYIDLLNFLEGLETLEFQVSPVHVEIEAELMDEDLEVNPELDQYLSVVMVLAL